MERSILVGCLATLFAALSMAVLPKACTTQAANDQAVIELHKESISGTYISAADQALIDISDEDFKKANQHANEFLRANRED